MPCAGALMNRCLDLPEEGGVGGRAGGRRLGKGGTPFLLRLQEPRELHGSSGARSGLSSPLSPFAFTLIHSVAGVEARGGGPGRGKGAHRARGGRQGKAEHGLPFARSLHRLEVEVPSSFYLFVGLAWQAKEAIAGGGYWSAIGGGSYYDYIWPQDPGVHKSCFGPAIPLPRAS